MFFTLQDTVSEVHVPFIKKLCRNAVLKTRGSCNQPLQWQSKGLSFEWLLGWKWL